MPGCRVARQVKRKAVDIVSIPLIDLREVHRAFLVNHTAETDQGYRNSTDAPSTFNWPYRCRNGRQLVRIISHAAPGERRTTPISWNHDNITKVKRGAHAWTGYLSHGYKSSNPEALSTPVCCVCRILRLRSEPDSLPGFGRMPEA